MESTILALLRPFHVGHAVKKVLQRNGSIIISAILVGILLFLHGASMGITRFAHCLGLFLHGSPVRSWARVLYLHWSICEVWDSMAVTGFSRKSGIFLVARTFRWSQGALKPSQRRSLRDLDAF